MYKRQHTHTSLSITCAHTHKKNPCLWCWHCASSPWCLSQCNLLLCKSLNGFPATELSDDYPQLWVNTVNKWLSQLWLSGMQNTFWSAECILKCGTQTHSEVWNVEHILTCRRHSYAWNSEHVPSLVCSQVRHSTTFQYRVKDFLLFFSPDFRF